MRRLSSSLLPGLLLTALPLPGALAPTNLRSATPFISGSAIELAWEDNSDDEDGFEYEVSLDGLTGWTRLGSAREGQALHSTITGIDLDTDYHFRVRALSSASGNSDWSNVTLVSTPASVSIWVRSGVAGGGTPGSTISTPALQTFGAPATNISAAGLPDGMTINPANGVISGTAPAPGIYRPLVTITDGTGEASTFVTIRIREPLSGPVAPAALPDALFLDAPGQPITLDLNDYFHDPDTSEAVRISTNLGSVDTILFPEACPAHVANFLGYVGRGDYTDVIFHRSAMTATSGVAVVQAGLMKPDGAGDYTRVPARPTVPDEPGLSNRLGTFAMAKTSSRNSGTSQWYFNTIDNTNLDGRQSNYGYTVFGRAATPSLPVLAEMHARPRGRYTVLLDGSSATLSDWPTTAIPAGAVPAPEELILINSITPISELLAYELDANSNPSLVTATVSGSALALTPLPGATGTATITVRATDLDGTSLSIDFDYCVLDLDLRARRSAAGRLAAEFNHEKLPPGLSYAVQRSLDGQGWTTFWRTSDGLAAAPVVMAIDQGTRWRLTVEDAATAPPVPRTALVRVVVTKVP